MRAATSCLNALLPDAAHERILLVKLQAAAESVAEVVSSARNVGAASTRTLPGGASASADLPPRLAAAAAVALRHLAPAAALLLPSPWRTGRRRAQRSCTGNAQRVLSKFSALLTRLTSAASSAVAEHVTVAAMARPMCSICHSAYTAECELQARALLFPCVCLWLTRVHRVGVAGVWARVSWPMRACLVSQPRRRATCTQRRRELSNLQGVQLRYALRAQGRY